MTHLSGRGIRFLYLIVIAHMLSPEEVGIFTYGMALYLSLFGLSQFGQQGVLSTRIGRSHRARGILIAHSLTLRLAMTGVIAALLLVYVVVTEPSPQIRLAVIFFVLALIPRSVVFWVRQCYLAMENTSWIPRWEVGFRGAEAALGAVALWLGGGLLAICFLHFAIWTLELGAALRRLVNQGGVRLRLGWDLRLLKRISQVSIFFMLSYWLADTFQIVAVVIVKELQPDTAMVGILGLAMQFLSTVMVIFVTLGDALVPRLSRVYARQGAGRLEEIPQLMCSVMLGGGLTAILASSYAPPLFEWMLGERYLQVGPLFALLCWALGPFAVVLLSIQILNAVGGWRDGMIVAAVAMAVQLGLLLSWAADGDVFRAGGAIVVASFVGAAVGIALLANRISSMEAARGYLALGLLAGAFALVELGPFDTPWAGALAAAAYLLTNWLSKAVTPDDLAALVARLYSQMARPAVP